jgi:hypothetical protein
VGGAASGILEEKKMTMELLRGKAAHPVVTTAIIALMLVVSSAYAQSSAPNLRSNAAPAPANEADIDAFLKNLDKTPPVPPVSSAPVVPIVRQAPPVTAAPPAPVARADARPPLPADDYSSPVRTLLLMFGGIVVCALATVGLTLTFFALRKDMKRRKRAHRRRFNDFGPDSAVQAAHR